MPPNRLHGDRAGPLRDHGPQAHAGEEGRPHGHALARAPQPPPRGLRARQRPHGERGREAHAAPARHDQGLFPPLYYGILYYIIL